MPLMLIFGLFSGCLLSVLVGMLGARRHIGFGWAFILSLLLTPLVGLIITLLSTPLPYISESRWGCLGYLVAICGGLLLIPFILMLLSLLMLI